VNFCSSKIKVAQHGAAVGHADRRHLFGANSVFDFDHRGKRKGLNKKPQYVKENVSREGRGASVYEYPIRKISKSY
jgi:hypothetical protein